MKVDNLPFSGLKRPMNQSPLAWAPHCICHFLGSRVALEHALPCVQSKQAQSYYTGKSKYVVAERQTSICVLIPFAYGGGLT